ESFRAANERALVVLSMRLSYRMIHEEGRYLLCVDACHAGSINGFLAEPDHTAYDTSKGAVAAMVRSLCVSLAPHRIRVNSMAPGLVRTQLTDVVNHDTSIESWMQLHTPNGQIPSPDACVGAAIFLLSDVAEHVHGQTLLVDGGMSAWQQPDLPVDQ
ncbi:MAG: SDR family NAD(P)-dependent oxidoreductase, partial [Rhodopirellula sp. JB055]|uniref:SDR family NAD(P)-dependent oxidoreductase n=1 Tax=Rhodopirellula sp. JB055 TaxID=3342846 RepID=UPI00370C6A53